MAEEKKLWYVLYSSSRNGYLIASLSNLQAAMKEEAPCEILGNYSTLREASQAVEIFREKSISQNPIHD